MNRTALSRSTTITGDDVYSSAFHLSDSMEASLAWFHQQKRKVAASRKLFEDPFFPCQASSVYFSKSSSFEWKRPTELCPNPEFISAGVSRFDVCQGQLGDCWLLAAIASLSLHKEMFERIIPPDQSFRREQGYCGMFLFRAWHFGRWVDVVVDDRLPTQNNKLCFMHSTDKAEFWSALLEKAYAKMNSSYEALKGGNTCEAMEDFTGGITEMFELGTKTPSNLWSIVIKANSRCSLMGCSIDAGEGEIETKAQFGLLKGHAYSVTGLTTLQVGGNAVRLIRIRNPWGNEKEWEGDWSDNSPLWRKVSSRERDKLELNVASDGEFWMSFENFCRYFTKLEICNLNPEISVNQMSGFAKRKWEMQLEDGEWIRPSSAGGCRNFLKTFQLNPQYRITVTDPDEDDDEKQCTLIIGLMQKGSRKRRQEGGENLTIGYVVYKLNDSRYDSKRLDKEFFQTNKTYAKSPSFINLREVVGRHKVDPGNYVIIPSSFEPNEESKFILRIFSEQPNQTKEMDEKTEIVDMRKRADADITPDERSRERESEAKLRSVFEKLAGADGEIDATELKNILNAAFKKENFKFDGFSKETARSMIALMDNDQSGRLGFEEFKTLWDDIRIWKTVFKTFDNDKSGAFNTSELRGALHELGFHVSNKIFASIAMRYSSRAGEISFDDYILLLVRLRTVFLTFKSKQNSSQKHAEQTALFSCEQFIHSMMYV